MQLMPWPNQHSLGLLPTEDGVEVVEVQWWTDSLRHLILHSFKSLNFHLSKRKSKKAALEINLMSLWTLRLHRIYPPLVQDHQWWRKILNCIPLDLTLLWWTRPPFLESQIRNNSYLLNAKKVHFYNKLLFNSPS
jgi:hypothetical protein